MLLKVNIVIHHGQWLTKPVPVRSLKLSNHSRGQYIDGDYLESGRLQPMENQVCPKSLTGMSVLSIETKRFGMENQRPNFTQNGWCTTPMG